MQLVAWLRGQRNPRKLEPSLTVHNPHLTNVGLDPASTLSEIELSLRDRRVLQYTIRKLFITVRRCCMCSLESAEDLMRNRINVSSSINAICLSRVCIASPVIRVSMRT